MKRVMTIMGMLLLTLGISCRKADTNEEAGGNAHADDKIIETESLKGRQALLTETRKADTGDIAADLPKHEQHIDPASRLKMQVDVEKARAGRGNEAQLASLKKSYLSLTEVMYGRIKGKPIVRPDGKLDEERLGVTSVWIDALVLNDRAAEALELALESRRAFDKARELKARKMAKKHAGRPGHREIVEIMKSRIPVDLHIEWNVARCLAATGKHREAMSIYVRLIKSMEQRTDDESKRKLRRLQLEYLEAYIKSLGNDEERIRKLIDYINYIEPDLARLGGNSCGGLKAAFFSVAEQKTG
jgi:tetratricopeptide (TPR) repeat protein